MAKTGRPTKFNDTMIVQVEKLARLGATDEEIADFLGICIQTLHTWVKEHPEFMEARKRGKDYIDAQVEQSLFRRAMGYTHESVKIFNASGEPLIVPYTEKFAPDTTACIFWLKNRQPAEWRDKIEHDHKGGVTIVLNGDDAEL